MNQAQRRNLRNGLLFISPWLLGVTVFLLVPVVMSVYYSLSDFSVINPPVFIGLGNFSDLMQDEVFFKSVWNTLIYALFALPLSTLLALVLAILLNAPIIGRSVFRTIFFIPSLVPMVALAVLWGWIFNGKYGVLNYFLGLVGVTGPNWLGDPLWAKPAILITGLWGVGNAIVIYLAGLQEISPSYYEAARVDGASAWQQTCYITLPLLSPVIYFNLLMGCIGVLQIFAVPYVMTGQGPDRSTLFYTMYIFDHAFRYFNMGYACAMAWILFFMIALLTWLAHRLTRSHVYYGSN